MLTMMQAVAATPDLKFMNGRTDAVAILSAQIDSCTVLELRHHVFSSNMLQVKTSGLEKMYLVYDIVFKKNICGGLIPIPVVANVTEISDTNEGGELVFHIANNMRSAYYQHTMQLQDFNTGLIDVIEIEITWTADARNERLHSSDAQIFRHATIDGRVVFNGLNILEIADSVTAYITSTKN
jgi:hypothetical protein